VCRLKALSRQASSGRWRPDYLELGGGDQADNDMDGQLNDAVYHQLFDTAKNTWLIQ